jgi:hypothetical protein
MGKRATVASTLSWTAHACVLLSVDPGARGGWALFVRGKRMASGVARNALERAAVIARAQAYEAEFGIALVVVGEKWSRGGWFSFDVIVGTGAAWGRWAEALELAEHPARRIVRVLPATWRAPTVGKHKGSDAYKAAAIKRVRGLYRIEVGADEAEALCIGEWGSRAPEVLELLPKARRAS